MITFFHSARVCSTTGVLTADDHWLLKSSYEKFPVKVDFSNILVGGESVSTGTIISLDSEGTLDSTIIDSDSISPLSTGVSHYFQDGALTNSPYRVVYRVVTDEGNNYEMEIELRVSDDPTDIQDGELVTIGGEQATIGGEVLVW